MMLAKKFICQMIVPFELEVFFFLEKIYNRLMILLLE